MTGIGGIFFKAADPGKLREWYQEHLGISSSDGKSVDFYWRDAIDARRIGRTVWSIFPETTDYFGTTGRGLMINYRVRDLDALLFELHTKGVRQIGQIAEYSYGRFAWIVDGEGNRVELWEPADVRPLPSE